jgi:phytoene synthase
MTLAVIWAYHPSQPNLEEKNVGRAERTTRPAASRPTPAVLADAELCRLLTRRHSSSFYLASLLFPPARRQAVWAVYAACRQGDDIVDEMHPAEAAPALAAWHARITGALKGEGGSEPVSRALARAADAYGIRQEPFDGLHAGFLMDLSGQRYENLDELLLYCQRVGGTVGCMVLPVAGAGEAGADVVEAATRLGTAMQLTNVLRDVGEDLARGRVYLPSDLMDRHGVTVEDLRRGFVTSGYEGLLRELADLADRLYAEALPATRSLEPTSRLAVTAAAAFYRAIGESLAGSGWDNLNRRASVTTSNKLRLLPRAIWQAFGPGPTVALDQA